MKDKGKPTVTHIYCVITLKIGDIFYNYNIKTTKRKKCLSFSKFILLIINFYFLMQFNLLFSKKKILIEFFLFIYC